jgi:DNA-binding NtrC family response regulator
MYRLCVVPLNVPPLRCRDTDAEHLAQFFLDELNQQEGGRKYFSDGAQRMLRAHHWPGNVRELKNAVQRAFILADEVVELEIADSVAHQRGYSDSDIVISPGTSLAEAERALILATLRAAKGSKTRTAQLLGISLKTLYNRLHEYGVSAAGQATERWPAQPEAGPATA